MELKDLLRLVPESSSAYPAAIEYGAPGDYITGVAGLGNAAPDELTFVRTRHFKRRCIESDPAVPHFTNSRFSIMPLAARGLPHPGATWIFSEDPRLLFGYMSRLFIPLPHGRVDGTSILGQDVVLEDVTLGKDCYIERGAIIMHATLGDRVRIGPGVVIGGQGFGFATDPGNGNVVKFPQLGRVVIGNDVEICAQTTIARGALDDTVIGDMVKMDQLVHVAHGVKIGKGTLVMADAMIAGSTRIGRYCWIAPGTQVINKVEIGDFAMTGLGAVVIKDVERNALVVGVPAKKLRDRFEEDDPILQL